MTKDAHKNPSAEKKDSRIIAIEIDRLNKWFGRFHVLKEISDHDISDISIHSMALEDVFMQYYSGGK